MEKEYADQIGAAYSRMYTKLYDDALWRLHDRETARDMVNNVFMEVLKHRIWWCAQKRAVQEKYVTAACERLCAAYLRRERRRFQIPYDEQKRAGNDLQDGIARVELRESLDRCMALLEPDERLLLRKKYFENYSTVQLGRLIGISGANVLQRLARARKKLRMILERSGIRSNLF